LIELLFRSDGPIPHGLSHSISSKCSLIGPFDFGSALGGTGIFELAAVDANPEHFKLELNPTEIDATDHATAE
jgi:hypothetical protein